MIAAVILGAFLAAVAIGVVVVVRRPARTDRVLRWSAFLLTVAVAALLTPETVADSGAAAGYLLGVPVLAAAVPVIADAAGRLVGVADVVGGVVLVLWALLLALGIGAAFLPPAALSIAALMAGLARRPASRWSPPAA